MLSSRAGDIWPATDIFMPTHVRTGYGHSGATTGPATEARYGADRAPSAERARLLDHQRAVPREDRAGRVCDARGAVRGFGVRGGGHLRTRPGEEAGALLTSLGAVPEISVIARQSRLRRSSRTRRTHSSRRTWRTLMNERASSQSLRVGAGSRGSR